MRDNSKQCARDVLDTVPLVMRFIRDQVRLRRSAGLSLPQFRTMVFLKRTRRASLSAVSEHLGLSLPAMSRLINGLVRGGLLERETVLTNRRQVALTLTSRGQTTLEKARSEIRLHLAASLKQLTAADQKAVQDTMRLLRRVFDYPVPKLPA
jgi:DNA-binding MarR family transcriptional regulator